jgi:acetyl esterase/lipase
VSGAGDDTRDPGDAVETAGTGARRGRIASAFGLLRLALAALVLAFSLLAVFPAPHGALWIPAILATEWGHWIGPAALLLLVPGTGGPLAPGRAMLALVAAALLLSPVVRARGVALDLERRLMSAFGRAPAPPPSLLRDIAPGAEPLPLADLLPGAGLLGAQPPVACTTHVYVERAAAEGGALRLDLYRRGNIPRERPLPVVVVVHGGSWRSGDRDQLSELNRFIAARGHAVAAIQYRLGPRFPFPAARADVVAALAFLTREGAALGIDGARIVLLGRSAGGQLALLVAYTRGGPAIRGVIALYAPTDLEWSWENPANPRVHRSREILASYLAGPPATEGARYREASPLAFAHADAPPTLLIHGGRDEIVSPRQSERLAARLAELRVPHLHVALPWATHGCEANLRGPSGLLATYAIERFLGSVLGR